MVQPYVKTSDARWRYSIKEDGVTTSTTGLYKGIVTSKFSHSGVVKSNYVFPTEHSSSLLIKDVANSVFSGTQTSSWRHRSIYGTGYSESHFGTTWRWPSTFSLDARAVLSFQKSTANNQAGLGVMFGEGKETVMYLIARVKLLSAMILAIRSGSPKSIAKAFNLTKKYLKKNPPSKTASGRWLEYSFAIKPLISDIYTVSQLIANWKTISDFDLFITSKGSARSYGESYDDAFYTSNPSMYGSFYVDLKYRFEQQINIKGFWRVADAKVRLASLIGLVNPATVAWNLVPFSFVVDWLFPVGDFLDSFTYDAGLEWENGYSTLWQHQRGDVDKIRPSLVDMTTLGGQVMGSTSLIETNRRLLSSPPRYNIYLDFSNIGFWHLLTSFALIRQVFYK